MDELDKIDPLTGHSHSLSGVTMRPRRPKPAPSAEDVVALMGTKLAESQANLAKQLAGVLTSRLQVEPDRVVPKTTQVSFKMTRNAAGQLSGGTVTTDTGAVWSLGLDRTGNGVSVVLTKEE